MEPLEEVVEEYSWREVVLPSLIPVVPELELERETGERRRGRDLLVAIDHGPNSKHAYDWALVHLCRLADTLHLVHAVSSKYYAQTDHNTPSCPHLFSTDVLYSCLCSAPHPLGHIVCTNL
ncbi:hypothetical protein COCNU_scaffold002246G000060 [Cocos nucifera]|nr:hypothetical protein [Cocos nucifera]